MIDEHSIAVADLPTTFGRIPYNAEILSQLKNHEHICADYIKYYFRLILFIKLLLIQNRLFLELISPDC